MSKLIPVLFLLAGLAGGIAAGWALQEPAQPPDVASEETPPAGEDEAKPSADSEYVRLNNQFVVPVVGGDRVESMVVLTLSLETAYGLRDTVYEKEPKLRDKFLRVLFDHANMGGFGDTLTDVEMIDTLRAALTASAREVLGTDLQGVLIMDIARQDM